MHSYKLEPVVFLHLYPINDDRFVDPAFPLLKSAISSGPAEQIPFSEFGEEDGVER